MKRPLAIGLSLAGVLACSERPGPSEPGDVPQPALSPSVSSLKKKIPGRYLVLLRHDEADVSKKATELAGKHGGRLRSVWRHALKGFAIELDSAKAERLSREPGVELVEQDQVYSVQVNGTQTPVPSGAWGLGVIDGVSDQGFLFKRSGAGVRFYGIDTGILATHGDFSGRVQGGFTGIADGRGTSDCHGHGTHTASTAGGETYGVAKDVLIVPVRVFDCSGNTVGESILNGVNWVTGNAIRPAVANMSLSGGASAVMDAAVTNSINSGIVYVMASGNGTNNNGIATDACLFSPGRVGPALTVGATTPGMARASYSNFGTCVDLFAPGDQVRAAHWTSNGATLVRSGTSMAAPHVAGAVAQYLEASPTSTPAQVGSAIIANARSGLISGVGSGSPNRFLSTAFIPGVSATISGPTKVNGTNPWFPTTFSWTANPAGGTSYTYQWTYYSCPGGTPSPQGTTQTISIGITSGGNDFWLKAVVTSGSVSFAALIFVDNTSTNPGPLPCHRPTF